MEELAAKYPYVGAQGRPIRDRGQRDTPSFETYNRGELATYGLRTSASWKKHYLKMVAEGREPG